ncbi:hypothetical protein IMY05_C4371001600 [Salix suchowensis]|nr:hypothetical protein IMY05_C4371001600 [Salix suchowensis]
MLRITSTDFRLSMNIITPSSITQRKEDGQSRSPTAHPSPKLPDQLTIPSTYTSWSNATTTIPRSIASARSSTSAPQPVSRTQTSSTSDPRRRLSAGSLARQAESSLPNDPTHRDAAESATSGRASFDHLDAGRSDLRRTENSEEVRVKQEELQAAVQEYQVRRTRDSSTLTNHDGTPRSQSLVKEELNDLVAEYLTRVKREVKQEANGDRWIKKEEDDDERSTTAVTERSGSSERKHDRRSDTMSMPPTRPTVDSKFHVVKQEERDFPWLKQEEEDLSERSTMTASVAPDREWFEREDRSEGTIPNNPSVRGKCRIPTFQAN